MKNLPFTVYDIMASLSCGSVVVAAVDILYGNQWLLKDSLSSTLSLFLVFMAYLSGHVVAHFSSMLLEDGFASRVLGRPSEILMGTSPISFWHHVFRAYFKPLPTTTQARIRLNAQLRGIATSGEPLFLHAFSIVTREQLQRDRLDEFRNLYGFCRNISLSFLAASPLLTLGTALHQNPTTYWWSAASFSLGAAMLYRYLKFYRQYSYQLLVTYSELQPEEP